MRVLQINIRATQGGAGRMCLDLHRGLLNAGHESRVLYGYGSGIAPDPAVAGQPEITMLGTRPVVLANYAAHRLAGRELFTASRTALRAGIGWADIIHLHAPHHYFLSWKHLAAEIAASGKPVLATAHDWWFITGRCGFVGDCRGWVQGCGRCGPRRFGRHLPSLLDRSAPLRRAKIASIEALGARVRFACPSLHLTADYAETFGAARVVHVPNAVDREIEAALADQPKAERRFYLFSASDLSSAGKIDPELVSGLLPELGARARFVGRNFPFAGHAECNLGELRSRRDMAAILARSRALVFTSQMDNAPLTILEALFAGTPVVALPSPAAEEMLCAVGGRCTGGRAELREILLCGDVHALYGGQSNEAIARRARGAFSGRRLVARYLEQYGDLLGRERAA